MEEGLLDIGHKCCVSDCPNIDYLVYKCNRCTKSYCSSHRAAVYECCQRLNENTQENTPKRHKISCQLTDCNDEVFQDSIYCLKHRHEGTSTPTAQKRTISTAQADKLAAIKSKFGSKNTSTTKPKKFDKKIWAMKVRMNAKPLREVLDSSDRIHISVSTEDAIELTSSRFYYFSKALSMGRLLDIICQKFSIDSSKCEMYKKDTELIKLNLSSIAGEIPDLDCSHIWLKIIN